VSDHWGGRAVDAIAMAAKAAIAMQAAMSFFMNDFLQADRQGRRSGADIKTEAAYGASVDG
jgi:hypothetical protein